MCATRHGTSNGPLAVTILQEAMMATHDSIQSGILPIPDRKPIGLTTYAKDPDTTDPAAEINCTR